MASGAGAVFESVNLYDFVSNWESDIVDATWKDGQIIPFESYVRESLGQSEDVIEELGEVCCVDRLQCEGEVENRHTNLEDVPGSVNLQTLHFQKLDLEKRKNVNYMQLWRRYLKYKFLYQHSVQAFGRSIPHQSPDIELPEILINVRIYLPYCPTQRLNLSLHQEFQVLGSQPLSALRDQIQCTSDNFGALERTSGAGPCLPENFKTKHLYKSSFFFINNVFYNDHRDGCVDCSDVVIKWMEKHNPPARPYKKGDMGETTFSDLSVQLGYPYLYMHQGSCEHLISFTDVVLLSRHDCLDIDRYPMLVGHFKKRAQHCRACIKATAVWMVRGSILTPEDPCPMCHTCFQALHYDEEGNKVVKFSAYIINTS